MFAIFCPLRGIFLELTFIYLSAMSLSFPCSKSTEEELDCEKMA